jgi:hypothetical protein
LIELELGNGRRGRRTLEREKHRGNHMKNNKKYAQCFDSKFIMMF